MDQGLPIKIPHYSSHLLIQGVGEVQSFPVLRNTKGPHFGEQWQCLPTLSAVFFVTCLPTYL